MKMLYRSVVVGVLLVFAAVPPEAGACSCLWAGPFLTVGPTADLVVRGKVLKYIGKKAGVDLSMDVEVQEVLKGATRAKTIRIWGDDGAMCRPYVSGFPVGTEWIFAINVLREPRPHEEYYMSVCGAYSLQIKDAEVIGHISSKELTIEPQTMALDELKAQFARALPPT